MQSIIIFIFSFFMIFQSAMAEEFMLNHPHWQETISVVNSKFQNKDGKKGSFFKLSPEVILLDWEKEHAEVFVYNKSKNIWEFLEKDERFKINNEYNKKEYSFKKPYVKVDAFMRSPLSALVKFQTSEPVRITVKVVGKGTPDVVYSFDEYRKEHEVPLVGLFADYKNMVVITATNRQGIKNSEKITVQTEDVFVDERWQRIKKSDKSFNYYALGNGQIYDEMGNLRYLFSTPGERRIYYHKNNIYTETSREIKKYSLLGETLGVYKYPTGFRGYTNAIAFKPNGNLLIFGDYAGKKALFGKKEHDTMRDYVLELDKKTGNVVAEYDLARLLNPDRPLVANPFKTGYSRADWAHLSGIDYDDKNSEIVVSGKHIGIVKIDEKTQKAIWWMTPHQLTHKSGRNGDKGDISHLLLTAVDGNKKVYPPVVQKGIKQGYGFKWPLKTQSVKYAGNGVYTVFDRSGKLEDMNLYTTTNSIASVFKVDDKAKTVRQLFFKDLLAYSDWGSMVMLHPVTNEIWVFLENVPYKKGSIKKGSFIYRFGLKNVLLFSAFLQKRQQNAAYFIQPYDFYNNE